MLAVLPISVALSGSDYVTTARAEEQPGEDSGDGVNDNTPPVPQGPVNESGIPEGGWPDTVSSMDEDTSDDTGGGDDNTDADTDGDGDSTNDGDDTDDGGENDNTDGDSTDTYGADGTDTTSEGDDTDQPGDGTTDGDGEDGEDVEDGEDKENVCICDDKCTEHSYNPDCEVCAENHKQCAYKVPDVLITITSPPGWYSDKATVSVSAKDISETGNFIIREVRGRIGTNGSWMDITESMAIDISENCVIYVEVTDIKGKTYERNRAIVCFDRTKPTINASVSDGLLTIQAIDSDSGIKVIYVNGHEFTEGITNGTLNIRLQEFDSNYEYFTIQAMDKAGNMSEVYRTQNPYYKDPEMEDDGSVPSLPENATPTEPTTAQAQVTEHVTTNGNGNAITPYPSSGSSSSYSSYSSSDKDDDDDEDKDKTSSSETRYIENTERGKEFYTIQTESEKVFYLIVDRNGENETVFFLTEVSERDLLNVTETSETLPQNTAVPESAIPQPETITITNNPVTEELPAEEEPEEEETQDEEQTEEEETEVKKKGGILSWIVLILLGGIAGGAYYFFKFKAGGPDSEYDEDEERDDEDEGEYDDQKPVSESEEDERARVPADFVNNFDTDDVTDTVE